MKQKVIRAGNSTAVTIPANFVKMVGVKIGDQVTVTQKTETGEVIYCFTGAHQLKLLNR